MELHVPGIGPRQVVLDVHQEAVCLDLFEPKRGVVRRRRLNVLHPRPVGVDVQPATVLSDERDSFRVGDDRHFRRRYRSPSGSTLGWASVRE